MTKENYDIRLKRIYDGVDPQDGARVLVDRLWPRGIRKADADLTLWLKEIAPSSDLRHWFDHDPAKFDAFAKRYREELAGNGEVMDRLIEIVRKGPVTLLYGAHDEVHNQAVVLAQVLKERLSTLPSA